MTPTRDALIAWVKEQEESDRMMAEQCSGAGLSPNRHNELRVAYAERADHFAALHARLVNQGWQPIETAPKDGTDVLLVGPSNVVGFGCWMDERFPAIECGVPVECGVDPGWYATSMWPGSEQPTFWQPLPAPPAPTEAA